MLRHSAVADALGDRPEEPPPLARRVAGQGAGERRADVLAAAREPEREPELSDAGDLPPLSYYHSTPHPESAFARWEVVAACAVGVLVAGGVTAYVLMHRSSTHAAAPPPSTMATVRQAEAWIHGNVPRAASVRADPTVAADLISAGYPDAGRDVSIGSAGAFLVITPQNRDRAHRELAGSATRISSLPVATFGKGAQQVNVSLLVDGSAPRLPARLSRETSERAAADRALLTNPRLTMPATLRPWLARGELDLRAATVVALLAARTDVHIARITLDPVEAVAARPARTVALSVTDPAMLAEVLRALPSSYAPTHASPLPGHARQLTWPVGLAPDGL